MAEQLTLKHPGLNAMDTCVTECAILSSYLLSLEAKTTRPGPDCNKFGS